MAQTSIDKLRKDDKRPKTVGEVMATYKDRFEQILPKHMTVERLMRLSMSEIRNNKRLQQADPMSLVGAIMRSAKLGLEPGLDAHLVPFRNNKANRTEVQMIPDYRGLMTLARRGGEIVRFEAQAVYSGDDFDFQFGTNQFLHHKPRGQTNNLTHVWALAEFKDGSQQFDVMDKEDVDRIKKRSRASSDGPWVTDYDEMAKKTVIRRLSKQLPRSIELREAVRMDELADIGESQDNRSVIDVDFTVEETGDQPDPDQTPAREEPSKNQASPPKTTQVREQAPSVTKTDISDMPPEPPPPEPPKPKRPRGRPRKTPQKPADAPPPPPPPPEPPQTKAPPVDDSEPPKRSGPSDEAKHELGQFEKILQGSGPNEKEFLKSIADTLSDEVRGRALDMLENYMSGFEE